MSWSYLLIFFLLGLGVGSFLNVLVLRLNTGMTLQGRSKCFTCLKKLEWYDLIPLLSFVSVRGHCRYCGSKISIQYPVVELASGLLFFSVGYLIPPVNFQGSYDVMMILRDLITFTFFAILIAISVYDIRHKIIPDELSLALLGAALLFEGSVLYSFWNRGQLFSDLGAAMGAFLFFAGLWFLSKGKWMGFGDAKIAFSLGLFLGYPEVIWGIFFAFWIGAIFGVSMLALKFYTRKTEVPFAPFLALGSYLAFFLATLGIAPWYYGFVGLL